MTICLANGKKYIGKYEGNETDNYIGSGKLLKRAVAKHGKENFERIILEKYNSKEECREGEKKWIKLFDAVNSKDFYNIATGGEGGNTFAGIQGDERVKLIAKLKLRKKAIIPKGLTSVYNIQTKEKTKATIEEFINNNFLIGVSCKGLYVTPHGVFCSALTASKHHDNLDYTSLSKRCKNPSNKVAKSHLATDKRLSLNDLGKTFQELGYDFIKKENITLEFLQKNKIIKT